MIIPEFIGYCVESLALAIWRAKPVQALRNWVTEDQDRGEVYVFGGLMALWAFLCLIGLA